MASRQILLCRGLPVNGHASWTSGTFSGRRGAEDGKPFFCTPSDLSFQKSIRYTTCRRLYVRFFRYRHKPMLEAGIGVLFNAFSENAWHCMMCLQKYEGTSSKVPDCFSVVPKHAQPPLLLMKNAGSAILFSLRPDFGPFFVQKPLSEGGRYASS